MAAVLVSAGQEVLLDSLHTLCATLPVPGASWHRHVAAIASVRVDFERALDACAQRPDVLDLIAIALAGLLDAAFDPGADAALTAAYERFRALPIPAGEHPFLDEIVACLEAVEATFVCLSLDPAAARSFAA